MIRKYFSLCTLLFLITFSGCKKDTAEIVDDTPVIPQGILLVNDYIRSEFLARDMSYSVYLPSGYHKSLNKTYPVLYLLHGMWGNYLDWINNGMSTSVNYAIYSGEANEMIIAMPNGIDSFYCNNYNGGSLRYEDFFIQEFIPQIENKYRINSTKNGRAIAGLSMGGYGATFHAFKRPELFCCCYSMSGALDMGTSAPDLKEILNSKTDEDLEKLPRYIMECGTGDYLVYASNESFDQYLTDKEIEHTYIERAGIHDWNFWMACLPKVLKAVSEEFE